MPKEEPATGASNPGRSALEELRSLRIDRGPQSRAQARPGTRRSTRLLILFAVLAVLVASVALLRQPASRLLAERTGPMPETAIVVKTGGASAILVGSGYINADAVVTLGSTIPGRLRTVLVEKGDRVRRGQLLAQLEDDELRAELQVQRAALERDLKTATRHETLARGGATTMEALDTAHSQVASDRASLQLTEARLRQTRILSPLDGTVLERLAEPGSIVGPTTGAIFRLADMRKTVVEVDINEADLARLRVGQPADVALDAVPKHSYAGHLRELAQIADRAKAAVQGKVLLDAPDGEVRPGLSAKVTFRPSDAARQPEQLVVPEAALLPGDAVLVVRDGRVERRVVETRPLGNGTSAVVRGLSEGEVVVTTEKERLQPGQKLPRREP
jgi:RND family efflux transporter MFP subunit